MQAVCHRNSAASAIAVAVAVLGLMLGLSCAKAEPPPQADFKGEPTTGVVPLTVNFTDQSTGEITSWKWSFGDGSTDTTRNPSYIYEDAGTYVVYLEVKGPGGKDLETKTSYVYVLKISEAATKEMLEAETAIGRCMADAGAGVLGSVVTGWDGSAGKVTASGAGGTKDAASYFEGKTFKAKYDVGLDGKITCGVDVSWDNITWDAAHRRWI